MKRIELTQGKYAVVDDADYEWLNQWKWYASEGKHSSVAQRCQRINGAKITILMHRQIMHTPKGLEVDHINHNGLDNRRCNLRNYTHTQNNHNRHIIRGKSKYKGVHWRTQDDMWQAQIKINKKLIHIGRFINEVEAAKAYDAKARELFGDFAYTNF